MAVGIEQIKPGAVFRFKTAPRRVTSLSKPFGTGFKVNWEYADGKKRGGLTGSQWVHYFKSDALEQIPDLAAAVESRRLLSGREVVTGNYATESIRELRRHPAPIRYSMVAMFCWRRRQQLTDALIDMLCTAASREALDPAVLQRRLLLCLFGIGTNIGLKRVGSQQPSVTFDELRYVKRRYVNKEALRAAVAEIVNGTFAIRQAPIWGEATTSCASDSKQFGAYDQNLMTEWHARYGGRGIMIYWHVDKNSTCIYSQIKRCSSSEVAAMMEGVLRHCTTMEIEQQYVDTHGQSEVAFAFSYILGFDLLPRLELIARQKLSMVDADDAKQYANLAPILVRAIKWDLIAQQYDEIIKYTTALRLGTADSEAILRRFSRADPVHPTYQARAELGKAVKTIFLCRYLHEESLRREIHEGLNVVENWNSANSFIFYGEKGEIATNRVEDQELAMLSLHLLQACLVYVNTLFIQEVLAEPVWRERMTADDWRALSPLIYHHVNPYGRIELDMNRRLPGTLIPTSAPGRIGLGDLRFPTSECK